MLVIVKGNFRVQLLKHSVNPIGEEAITFFWTYERFIHAEVMTHRTFSRNYSSSRAIPYERMMEWVGKDPANHLHLGSNQAGMVSGKEVDNADTLRSDIALKFFEMREWCDSLVDKYNPHKEVINRYTEPWGWITGMATMGRRAFMNFISLRCSRGANPNIQRVAISCLRLYKSSVPQQLEYMQWHTPFFDDYIPHGLVSDSNVRVGLIWSGARSAWCSYNNPTKDATFEKAQIRHDDCVKFKHVTPLEHPLQARNDGKAHGLVPGYNSYRSMIPGESVEDLNIDEILADYGDRDYIL